MDNFTGFKNGTVYVEGKPTVEIGSKFTTDFSKGANQGNSPSPQDIQNIIKTISKKEGE